MNIKIDISDLDLTDIIDVVSSEIPPSVVYKSHQATDVFASMMRSRDSKKNLTASHIQHSTTPTTATPRRSGITWGRMNVGDNR